MGGFRIGGRRRDDRGNCKEEGDDSVKGKAGKEKEGEPGKTSKKKEKGETIAMEDEEIMVIGETGKEEEGDDSVVTKMTRA